MSQLSGHSRDDPGSSPPNETTFHAPPQRISSAPLSLQTSVAPIHNWGTASPINTPITDSPIGTRNRNRSNSGRPLSLVQTFQPPVMDVGDDTIPELQPIFTFLNSHSNKLYQEGYFLKLDDQNTRR